MDLTPFSLSESFDQLDELLVTSGPKHSAAANGANGVSFISLVQMGSASFLYK